MQGDRDGSYLGSLRNISFFVSTSSFIIELLCVQEVVTHFI